MWDGPTTIGFERRYNPLLGVDQGTFVRTLTESVAARPLNITAIEATNRGDADLTWAMLTTSPQVEEMEAEAVEAAPADAVLLDVRELEEYAEGHISGSINLPQADLATRLDDIPRDRPVISICRSGARSLRSAQFLAQMGYPSVSSMRGGLDAWEQSGRPLKQGDPVASGRRIVETEWMHAGGLGQP